MRIGIIIGKEGEEYLYDDIRKMVPSKYYKTDIYGTKIINTDVAIAYTIKERYPLLKMDIIEPKNLSLQRLKKNDINFILGYDYISSLNESPYIKKFAGVEGSNKIAEMYASPSSKIFPSFNFLSFIWDKKRYLQHLQKHNIPISETIFFKGNQNHMKLLQKIQRYKWSYFIIKPNGGTEKGGVKIFSVKELLKQPSKLADYFSEMGEIWNEFLVQERIDGFLKYGEIKSYWMDGKFSYAVNIQDKNTDEPDENGDIFIYDDLIVHTEIIDKKVLDEIKKVGGKVIECIPKISFNRKRVLPAMVRIDFACCLHNRPKKASNYYVNEIEHQDAGSLTDMEEIKYPYVEVMADTFVKKCNELKL